jgi:hypothetical protein
MKKLLCLLAALPLLGAPEQEIRSVLDAQVAAWNRGDIPAFMEGYDKSESTTFVGGAITKGHAQVLANYLKRYPTHEKMGILRFSDLEMRMLGTDYASVIGRFHLDRAADAGGEAAGIFTLLFPHWAWLPRATLEAKPVPSLIRHSRCPILKRLRAPTFRTERGNAFKAGPLTN